MHPGLSLGYWLTLHGLVTLVAVLLYVITAHVLRQRRHPAAAIAWVLFILLMPYVALPAFLMFGSRKLARPRPRATPDPDALDGGDGSWAVQTAVALGQAEPSSYQELHVHADGKEALDALWRTIATAEHTLDLCTFIIGRDAVGKAVVERLAARARAGVRVRVMIDGLGRWMGGSPDLAPLRAAGARVMLFVPPLRSPLRGRSNLRDHRKMLIADAGHDGAQLWCGGRNLAAEYFGVEPHPHRHPRGGHHKAPGIGQVHLDVWHDLSFDLRGAFVDQAHALFEHDWQFATGRKALAPPPPSSALPGSETFDALFARTEPVPELFAQAASRRVAVETNPLPEPGTVPDGREALAATSAQLIASGPDQVDDTVYSLLVTAAYRAHERIALVTPYFVPDAALLQALCLAARRGVTVDLLLPARSNHLMSDIARTRALRSLHAAGGRIWLAPQMLHAKLAIVDHTFAMAGSANLDSRSLFLNYELMVAFHDRRAIAAFVAWFEREHLSARQHKPRPAGLLRDIGEGLVLWLGFQL
ncbi:MAG TPA: phospholipase D-like domain-containing protein [Burkholderiaceae bacterium]